MTARAKGARTVAIVGGGFCGAAAAYHLAQAAAPGVLDIVVVEPRPALGTGLAYSTLDPAHRINVPAAKMTLRTEDPQHFVNWLSRSDGPWMSPGTITLRGDMFPQRNLFGLYVADHLKPFLADGAVRHVRAKAVTVEPQGGAWRLGLSDGSTLRADALVIATSHPLPSLPQGLRGVADAAALIADPYDSERIDRIGPRDDVLIVGAGLTSADIVASLDRRGHFGRITVLSRRGLRSRGHGPNQAATSADFASHPSRTARALLRRARAAVENDARDGLTWHAALDRMRSQGQDIWAALDAAERGRLVRSLRVYWDVHRFRIAPQVEEVVERRLKARNLDFVAGRLTGAAQDGERIAASWRTRRDQSEETGAFDAVVVATGPAHGDLFAANPLAAALRRIGALRPDALGLGLVVDHRAHAVSARPAVGGPVLVCGPLARGTVGELMGVPEVTAHAELVAREIALWAEQIPDELARVS